MDEPLLVIVPCATAAGIILCTAALTWYTIRRRGHALFQEDYAVDKHYIATEQRWALLVAILSAVMLIAALGVSEQYDWGSGLFIAASLATALLMIVAFAVLAKRRSWQAESFVPTYEASTMGSIPTDSVKGRSYAPSQASMLSNIYSPVKPLSVIRRSTSTSDRSARSIPLAFHHDYPLVERSSPEMVPSMDFADGNADGRESRFSMPEFGEDSSAL